MEAVAAVGLAGSLISIVDFSIKTFKELKGYLSNAKRAPEWVQDAIENTSRVISHLERVKDTLEDGNYPPNAVEPLVKQCQSKAGALKAILDTLIRSPKPNSNKPKEFFRTVSLALESTRGQQSLKEMARILDQVKGSLNDELNRLGLQTQIRVTGAVGDIQDKQRRIIGGVEDIQDQQGRVIEGIGDIQDRQGRVIAVVGHIQDRQDRVVEVVGNIQDRQDRVSEVVEGFQGQQSRVVEAVEHIQDRQGRVTEVVEGIQDRTIEQSADLKEIKASLPRLEEIFRRELGSRESRSLVTFQNPQASREARGFSFAQHQYVIQTSQGQRDSILNEREIDQASIRRMRKSQCLPSCPCQCHNIKRRTADLRTGVISRAVMFMSSAVIPCSYSACRYREGVLDIRIPSNRFVDSKRIQLAFKVGRWTISPSVSFQPLIEGNAQSSPACQILYDILRPGSHLPKEGWTAAVTIRQLQRAFDDRRSFPTERFPIYSHPGDSGSRYLGSENLLSVAWYLLYPVESEDVPGEEVVKLIRFLIEQGCTMDTSPNLIGENCIFKLLYDVPEKSVEDHRGVMTLLHDAGWELGRLDQDIESREAKYLARRLLFSPFVKLLCISSHYCDGILGNSELFGVILRNDVQTAKRLLEKSADIDEAIEFSGDTCLHLAVMVQSTGLYHSADMIDMLLGWSPDVHAKNKRGLRPIDISAKHKLLDTAIKLLEAGSSPTDDRPFPSSFSILGYTKDIGCTEGSREFVQGVVFWCLANDKHAKIQDRLNRWLRFWIKQDDLEWCRIYLDAGANTDLRNFVWDFSVFKECAELIREYGGVFREDLDRKDVEHAVQAVAERPLFFGDRGGLLMRSLLDVARAGDMDKCILYLKVSMGIKFEGQEDCFGPLANLIRQHGGLLQFREGEERLHLQNHFNKYLRRWVERNHVEWCRLLLAAGADADLSDLHWDYSTSGSIVALILEHGGRVKYLADRNDKLRAAKAMLSLGGGMSFSERKRRLQDQGNTEWLEIYEEANAEIHPMDQAAFRILYYEIGKRDKDFLESTYDAEGWGKLRMALDWSIQHRYFPQIRGSLLSMMSYYADMALRFRDNASFLWRSQFYLEYCVRHVWRKDLKSEVPPEVLRLLRERGNRFRDAPEFVVSFVEEYGDGVHDVSGDEGSEDNDSGDREQAKDADDDGDEFFDC